MCSTNYMAYNIYIKHWLYQEATPKNEVKSTIRHLQSNYDRNLIVKSSTLTFKCKTQQNKTNNAEKKLIKRLTLYKMQFQVPEGLQFFNRLFYNQLFYDHDDKVMKEQFYKKNKIIYFDIPRISKYQEYLSKMRVLI